MATIPPSIKPMGILISLITAWHQSKVGRAMARRRDQLRHVAASAKLRARLGGCGERTIFSFPLVIEQPERVQIGDNVSIAAYVHVWGGGGVQIGSRTMIASHVAITSITHDYTVVEMHNSVVSKPVIIGADVWIGSHAVIMPGVIVGRGVVIGAGSVVTHDIPDFAIVVGTPARIVKERPNSAR